MNYNRRKFIKTLMLGTGSLLIPSFSFSNTTKSQSSNSFNLLELKKNASEAFYRREYNKSESLYKDLISKNNKDISSYDGLTKIYYKQAQYLKAVELLTKGLDENKENHLFYDRLARSLVRLSLGNRKQEMEYIYKSGNEFIIKTAIELYLEAINIEPNKKYLREGLLDVVKCLDKKNKQLKDKQQNELILDSQILEDVNLKTVAYRGVWSKTRNSNKLQIQNLDDKFLLMAIEKSDNKKRRKLYFDDEHQSRFNEIQKYKGKYFQFLLLSSIAANNASSVTQHYSSIRKLTPKNTFLKGKVVNFYKKKSLHQNLQYLYEEEIQNNNNSLWSEICLAQLLLQDGNNLEGSKNLLNKVKANSIEFESSKFHGALSYGLAKCDFASNQYELGRVSLLGGMNTLVTGSVVNSLIINYAESYISERKHEEAKNILLRLRGVENVDCDKQIEDILDKMDKFQQERSLNSLNDNKKLKRQIISETEQNNSLGEELKTLYSLAKMYQKLGDHKEYTNVLNEINKIDSKDKFLKNRI